MKQSDKKGEIAVFCIGDKVVYPMHGAGTIEAIEEKEVMGKKENYYIMRMPVDDVKVMIPTEKAESVGMREVSNKSDAGQVYTILEAPMHELSCDSNWNKRYVANVEKIKSGSLKEVTEVFKELSHRRLEKGKISMGEKKMLNTSKNIMLSELVLAEGNAKEEIEEKIDRMVNFSFEKWKEDKEDSVTQV